MYIPRSYRCIVLRQYASRQAPDQSRPIETNRSFALSTTIDSNALPRDAMNRVLVPARTGILARWLNRLAPAPSCRRLHLAPPFLLDDYVPRYQTLSSRDEAKKRSLAYAHLRKCNLCPRLCGVNRFETTGMCLIGDKVKVNVVAPHFGEGPSACSCISRLPRTETGFVPELCLLMTALGFD